MASRLAYDYTYYLIFSLYLFSYRSYSWAASGFRGSVGLGYSSSWGKKISKMLIKSYMGDQVWLITSRQTEPDLCIQTKYE